MKIGFLAKFSFLAVAIAGAYLYNPPPAAAAAYCAYENDYYSDNTFTTQVGETDTNLCFINHSGTVTDNYIHYNEGECGNESCDEQKCSCSWNTYYCIDGVCND